MGFDLDVEIIRAAHEHGLVTTPHTFDAGKAVVMTKAGADVLMQHIRAHDERDHRRADGDDAG
ncbi:hypothetical protein GCM10011381_09000 [Klenkia taihuensis]|nr:hypothetical protein GCM10011381_09000 [Klenkia taihuensis]